MDRNNAIAAYKKATPYRATSKQSKADIEKLKTCRNIEGTLEQLLSRARQKLADDKMAQLVGTDKKRALTLIDVDAIDMELDRRLCPHLELPLFNKMRHAALLKQTVSRDDYKRLCLILFGDTKGRSFTAQTLNSGWV